MRALRKMAVRPSVAVPVLFIAAFCLAFIAGCASTQPHMQSALDHLSAARSELEAATPNKGGHRERAIELVNEAINQVEMGMHYARSH